MQRIAFLLVVLVTASFSQLVQTPPMGWNSWDCYGVDLNEQEIKANADYMAKHLKQYGWEYIVTDILWYGGEDINIVNFKKENPSQRIDEYGRLIPAENRYPSAKDGSFGAVANYIHSKGLKFGIHIMRGIPWQAVEQNTPILGTQYHAQDIVAYSDTCIWYDGMYGIDMSKPGAQGYYNSIAKLYAEWGVDYVKADDMSHPYHAAEIAGLSKALKNCGRDIVLSLSPGASPREQAEHLTEHANLWRVSPDFWDDWPFLFRQFELSTLWQGVGGPGHWPDADMLPIGKLRKRGSDDYVLEHMGFTMEEVTDEYSRFSDDEKRTLLTLWCIIRSPLMIGGNLPETDSFTYSLITNKEVLDVNQASLNNHQVYRNDPKIVWCADVPNSSDKYVALFNVDDEKAVNVDVNLLDLGINNKILVRDLWTGKNVGKFKKTFKATLPPHGSGIYRLITN